MNRGFYEIHRFCSSQWEPFDIEIVTDFGLLKQDDHENVGKEDDDGDEVEGMVDGESPVTQVWLLIAGVLTHQVENILEGLGDEGGGESFLSQIY